MMRLSVLLAALAAPGFALAQPTDPHAHHRPAPSPPVEDPHAHHRPAAEAAGHDSHVGHAPAAADPHAGHGQAPQSLGTPPPVPADHAADRIFSSARMASARQTLRLEHGGMRWTTVRVEMAEIRPTSGADIYAWEGEVSFGGDVDRFVLKTEGEGASDLKTAEVQGLWRRAIGPYFNAQAGIRQDFEPRPRRTYAVLGVEGVAPYWFEVGATAFLSDRGDLSARFEAAYDLRLTQKLILEPHAEAQLAATSDPAVGLGAGLSDIEAGVRLRYDLRPEFSPYIGVHWERSFGKTADLARAAGDHVSETQVAIGLRAWF